MHAENNLSNNSISKSSVYHVREVATSHSADNSNIINSSNDHNKKTLLIFDKSNGRKTKFDDFTPDYDVEYDVVKSPGDEYTAMASESMDRLPKNIMRMPHDGLPGFPPPHGISNDFNANVELSADASGFVIESPAQSGLTHIIVKNSAKNNEIIPKPSPNVDESLNLKPNTNRIKSMVKLSTQSIKSHPKRIPIFAEPLPELDLNMDSGQRKAKEEVKIGIPIKVMSRIPIRHEKRQNVSPQEISNEMKMALPALESTIRFLRLADEFAHPIEYGPGVQPSIAKIPIPVRRFLTHNNERVKSESLQKVRSKRESEKRLTLKVKSEKNSQLNDHFLEALQTQVDNDYDNSYTIPKHLKQYKAEKIELNTEESRYIPFDERSYVTESREDGDSGDSEGTNNENNSPLFNFDDFPTALSPARHHKHKDNNYSPDESRKHQKYGILGSGNFEIIRGGIYSDDESASNNVPNYVQENGQNNDRKSEQASDQFTPNSENNNEDDSEQNQFGPFNVDFFTGSPVLGFQGYDNFGATTLDKYKTQSPIRSSIKLRGQRRQFYDSHSAASNLFTITDDKDLDFDS